MSSSSLKNRRSRIHMRVRKRINGTPNLPRLSIFRSNKSIYCQLIDDSVGQTLVSATSNNSAVDKKGNKVDQAKMVGKLLADKAKSKNISRIVFDRSGYLYHGRIKALADGARENGLLF